MEEMDPLEELREVRKKIAAIAGGTPAGLMRYLRALEKPCASESPVSAQMRQRQVPAR